MPLGGVISESLESKGFEEGVAVGGGFEALKSIATGAFI
jgi:hypothetical protein